MAKKRSSTKKQPLGRRLRESAMNTLAVCSALLPIVFFGIWTQGVVSGQGPAQDDRKVSPQTVLTKNSTPQLFSEPLVSVTFDDGWQSVYTNGLPVLEKYGIRTTQYILPGEFDNYSYISKAQAHSMKDAGHEIGSHTVNHKMLTTLSPTDVKYELEISRSMLQKENLISADHTNFAPPNSAVNDSILQIIRTQYVSSRNTLADITNGMTDADVNLGPVLRPYDIIAYSVRPTTTIQQIQQALDYTKQHNGWFVLVYHQIDDSSTEYSVSASMLDKQLQAITESHIKTVTVGDVMMTNPRTE